MSISEWTQCRIYIWFFPVQSQPRRLAICQPNITRHVAKVPMLVCLMVFILFAYVWLQLFKSFPIYSGDDEKVRCPSIYINTCNTCCCCSDRGRTSTKLNSTESRFEAQFLTWLANNLLRLMVTRLVYQTNTRS